MEFEDPIYVALHAYTKALAVALGYRDSVTQLHSQRVLELSQAIGVRCGLSQRNLGILAIAASFHDIGKIGIPDHILLKSSRFEDADWKIMKMHCEMGQRIMAATELECSLQVALVIRHHHEHFKGPGGYPDGLSGEAIPLLSRIISIADSYDAMAQIRAYHPPRTHHEIMAILQKDAGTKYDPALMRHFSEVIESSELKAPGLTAG
jgi:response regulator RpfG family c-di-GMP phosphodiesterase